MVCNKTINQYIKMEYNKETNGCPEPEGILVIIGGKEDKGENEDEEKDENETPEGILKCFIGFIEKENPRIEIITTASSEGDESFADYKKAFGKLHVKNLGHIHHKTRKEILADDLTERVNKADAFFITGGDQLLLSSLYGGSRFLTQLKERYIKDKIVIAGTSAGAMCLSTPMIYAGNKEKQQITGSIKITTGLEFLRDVCIDTHFIDRARFIRMAQVIATNPTSVGIGIEEDTAVVVRKGDEAEIIGNGVVTVIEGFEISSSNITDFGEDAKISICDLRVHLLSKGNTYHIRQMNPPHK
jgi:cyanophycinase